MNDIIIVFGIFFGMLAIGVPVAFAMGAAALVGTTAFLHTSPSAVVVSSLGGLNKWPWIAVPLFMLLGSLMDACYITRKLINFMQSIVGHITGGLAHVSVAVNVIMAGMSGSILADAAAIGSIMIPDMKKAGYPPGYLAALIAAGAVIGPLIPPSIILILIGVICDLSILRLWLGGVMPGVLIAATLIAISHFICRKKNYARTGAATWQQRKSSTISALPALGIPIVIIGGMRGGMITPTEAGAVAVFYALVLGFFVYRTLKVKELYIACLSAAETCSSIMMVIAMATSLGWVLSMLNVGASIVELLTTITTGPIVFLLLTMSIFLVLGCVIDNVPIVLIFVPIVMPAVYTYGIDPIHFGVFISLIILIGQLTPPVGMAMYLTIRLADTDVTSYLRHGWPLLAGLLFDALLIAFVPQIVTFLPDVIMGLRTN